MKNPYTLRNEFIFRNYNTAITRADFEAHFTKTKERIEFTFNGWDGKSYNGESRRAYIYRTFRVTRKHGSSKSAVTCTSLTRRAGFWKRQPGSSTKKQSGWWMLRGHNRKRRKR